MGVGYLRTSVRCLTIPAAIVALAQAFIVLLTSALMVPSAHADELIPLGGGSRGHGGAAYGAVAAGVLGTMVAGNDSLDYAVIQFDPQKVLPVNNVKGFEIDGLGPDPVFGDVACKLGRTTGYSCGVTWGPGEQPGTIVNQVCGQPGDSGAPVTVNNRLVGMIHGAFSEELPTCVVKYIPLHTPAVTMSFNTQLADITAKNRPGTGFVPVGAVAA
jgi:hypothetical protein